MKISREEVLYVAKLARLSLSEEELNTMTGQLDNILSYVDQLAELNTDGVHPTSHVFNLTNVFRDDLVKTSLPQEVSVAAAPKQDGEAFLVPRVI